MGSRAIENRIKKLRELEKQRAAIEAEIENVKQEIKHDLMEKGLNELHTDNFIIRFSKVVTKRFDSKAFSKEHESLYNQYLKQTESMRFSIA